ncbi:FkbM family methyltransferase [Aurantiacibacter luteus]|uniref:FkbM family methyltransferase n=1 Tax=Aurantiacibacter luteus TaxID=1581420 RepID=UPI0012E096BF|nr:FkbM family methyltransferase [Aurantiacibacter luteus]
MSPLNDGLAKIACRETFVRAKSGIPPNTWNLSVMATATRLALVRSLSPLRQLRGGERVARALVPQMAGEEIVVENDGIKITCDLSSYIEWQIATLKGYETRQKQIFLSVIPQHRRRNLLDIGANIGGHSLTFARFFDKVIAFEPNPEIFSRLQGNITRNSGLNIDPMPMGLADRADTLVFYQPPAGCGGQGVGSFDPDFAPNNAIEVRLPVARGDDVVKDQGLNPVDAIKIDVQGFEPQVLMGLADTIAQDKPIIWAEFSESTLRGLQASGSRMSQILAGYRMYKFAPALKFGLIHRVKLEPCDGIHSSEEADYLFLPPDVDKLMRAASL